jgi:hypothetical protein
MAFYLGRLDGRANTAALTTAMRALLPTIDTNTCGPAMKRMCGPASRGLISRLKLPEGQPLLKNEFAPRAPVLGGDTDTGAFPTRRALPAAARVQPIQI